MKLSQSTLVAILAASACANTYTIPELSHDLIVKRVDAYELLDLISELSQVMNQKRDLSENHEDYHVLTARADSALGNFVVALTNSGLIGDVFKIITCDAALQTQLSATIKSAVQGLLIQGPALVSAIWNSGLMQEVFMKFLNDPDLRDSFVAVMKQIVSSGINKITTILGSKLGKLPPIVPQATNPPVARRDYSALEIESIKRAVNVEFVSEGEFLDKRDVTSTLIAVIQAIYNSGIIQSLVSKALADPIATISFLSSALKNGVVVVGDLIDWAKECGLIDSMLQYIASSGNAFLQEIIKFLAPLLQDAKPSTPPIESDETSTLTTITSTAVETTKKAKPTMDGLNILDAVAPILNEITKDFGNPTTMISSGVETSTTFVKRMLY